MLNLKNYNNDTVFMISGNIINIRAVCNLHQFLKRFCGAIEKAWEQQPKQLTSSPMLAM